MKNNNSKYISLGKSSKIDKSSIVGATPLRKNVNLKTIIGKNALFLSGSVLYLGSRIGEGLILGHNSIIREENVIGDSFNIWSNSTIDYGCKIGNRVKVHCNCYISQFTTIEDDCFFAPGVIVANDIHPGCSLSKKCMKGATIKKGAQIGCNVTILPFVTIGEGAMVGAGSVVVHDVAKGKVVCGNPAKVIKSVTDIKCLLYPGKKYLDLQEGIY